MSTYGRRYDSKRIKDVKYDSIMREKENSLYSLMDVNYDNIYFYIDDHVDYIILNIINFWKQKFISLDECNKLIDKVEGYYFAYEEHFINELQLYKKLNNEIMKDFFNVNINNYIGVYKNREVRNVDMY